MVKEGVLMIIPETLAINPPKDNLLKIINNKKFNDKILYKITSNFHKIKVIENEIGRFLHYGDTYQAGEIKTLYYSGNLPYINYFLLPYFFKKKIKKVLLIGLGTGRLVSDLFRLYPDIEQFDIVDIEENILEIAKRYFNFSLNDKTNFYLQDAFVFLNMIRTKYDLIITDVANNEGIEERFLSREYFSLIKNHLKKSGLFISNLCASPDLKNPENFFYNKLKNIYSNEFFEVKTYIGNYSDRIYYKSFFDINERVIDITNIIFISSLSKISFLPHKNILINNFKLLFNNIDITAILNDEICQTRHLSK